ncbi:hypothetical protein WN51_11007 [Melipona quadrifasciata]|uniref:Uncharacterized protein n=1 Tax=Melipona quadrifasciata TaxID=166423 RepID=A0A0N0BHR4_9HYME|nr:hypothetical protein WN51_11007 [Melipona quadrifasciata]
MHLRRSIRFLRTHCSNSNLTQAYSTVAVGYRKEQTVHHESLEIAIRTDILIYFSGSILPRQQNFNLLFCKKKISPYTEIRIPLLVLASCDNSCEYLRTSDNIFGNASLRNLDGDNWDE